MPRDVSNLISLAFEFFNHSIGQFFLNRQFFDSRIGVKNEDGCFEFFFIKAKKIIELSHSKWNFALVLTP